MTTVTSAIVLTRFVYFSIRFCFLLPVCFEIRNNIYLISSGQVCSTFLCLTWDAGLGFPSRHKNCSRPACLLPSKIHPPVKLGGTRVWADPRVRMSCSRRPEVDPGTLSSTIGDAYTGRLSKHATNLAYPAAWPSAGRLDLWAGQSLHWPAVTLVSSQLNKL
jgi:hypothetical protein